MKEGRRETEGARGRGYWMGKNINNYNICIGAFKCIYFISTSQISISIAILQKDSSVYNPFCSRSAYFFLPSFHQTHSLISIPHS